MRKRIIAGNWKMNKSVPEAVESCRQLEEVLDPRLEVDVVVCPAFTSLSPLNALGLKRIKLGAQNMYQAAQGAFTGEISPLMLRDVGCEYVIVGHSERRQVFGETDAMVNEKALAALENHLKPIICVGETIEQRRSGQTEDVVVRQVKSALGHVAAEQLERLVFAYEPVWAIGTGETATAEDANEVIAAMRKAIAELFDGEKAEEIRIQYGGSVNGKNSREFLTQPGIDGALVGGASLDSTEFARIVRS